MHRDEQLELISLEPRDYVSILANRCLKRVQVCCICLAKYADNDLLRELPCTHFFHIECVDKWLKINASCPLCKFEVGASNEASSTEDSSQQQS